MSLDSDDTFDYPEQRPVAFAMLDPSGKTANKTVLARHAPLRRQQGESGAFAPERHGNAVQTFITGEEYFRDVCAAIKTARQSVFIAGWQVNWAVQLDGQTRLIDALKCAVDNGAKVYVMPWQSPKVGVNTGDLGTMLAVFQLNCGRKNLQAFCCPAGLQNDHAGIEETFFSHHQKMVLVDGKKAYVGGIDLAFGRRDTASFELAHGWRTGPEVYNSCIPATHKLLPAEAVAYVDESEPLRSTLAVGPLKAVLNTQAQAGDAAASSSVGSALDAAVEWWRTPIDVESLPKLLREPVRWAQSAGKAAGELVDDATAPARRAYDDAQQKAADAFIYKLDHGAISAAQFTRVLDAARDAVRLAYNTLLGVSWLNETPYADLFKQGTQSTPGGNATYTADQPRMPWQDMQVRIEGPSVFDLAQNFMRRWNSVQKSYLPGALEQRTRIAPELMPAEPAPGKGNGGNGGVAVRVLRSAPLKLQQDEANATPAVPEAVARQHEIHDAMVSAIRNAERFIYIENQFFQSGFGTPSLDENDPLQRSGPLSYLNSSPVTRIQAALTRASAANANKRPGNRVSQAIADRIERAIRWGHDFHAYIVLPVHPEGSLADPAIIGQVHWTMQSLVYASDSLVNRVRLALYAKQMCKQPRSEGEWAAAKKKGLETSSDEKRKRQFEDAISIDAVSQHLTLLNLRNCQTVGGKVRTEQIYVHTKLLIVDDRIVIVGSANINDRSLAGGRDSELAVLLMDLATQTAPVDGKNPLHVRKLAHELRVKLWKKHFALLGHTDIVQPASNLASIVDKPADPSTWRAIQEVARANASAYAKAFNWVPRDGASIWPVWQGQKAYADNPAGRGQAKDKLKGIDAQMPFSPEFWTSKAAPAAPTGVSGFICALPMLWTEGENNHPDTNMALLTRLELPNESLTRESRLADSSTADTKSQQTLVG